MTQSEQKGRSILTNLLIVLIGQVGCLTLVIILASVFGGLWLDRVFDTKPVFTLALLFAGIPVSVFVMLLVARRTLARLQENVEKETDKSSQEADFGTS
jgi:F0F1-type ATP synthase assembly protein I